jgi:carbamoyltransferase
MERTLTFKEAARHKVPAIIHINRTGRLQSVRREWNEHFYDLIYAFYQLTGVPMLLNTSFNIMGKPIMHTVEDAIALFYTTGLDALILEDYLIEK